MAIVKGDMVRIIWGCCESSRRWIGVTSVVHEVAFLRTVGGCGYKVASRHVLMDFPHEGADWVPIAWVIKIEPEEEKEKLELEVEA